jgi:hypothetical protein
VEQSQIISHFRQNTRLSIHVDESSAAPSEGGVVWCDFEASLGREQVLELASDRCPGVRSEMIHELVSPDTLPQPVEERCCWLNPRASDFDRRAGAHVLPNQLPTEAGRRREGRCFPHSYAMARARIELATPRFSVVCSTN